MVRSQALGGLTISKLASAAGVGVETIRYYQRRGFLSEPSRDAGIRRYGPGDVERLCFIRSAQSAGFRLDEIGELLNLDQRHDRMRVQEIASARLVVLDAKITELQRIRTALSRLAAECAQEAEGPCPVLQAFSNRGADISSRK